MFAATIFSSAFLLFLVQPLISKYILPWFGGSAAVWATCMVFFQVVLMAGYAYSDWITRHLKPPHQITLHVTLLSVSLIFLPIIPDPSWKPIGTEDPSLWILVLLTSTIGLPYFLVSTTGPLLQAWVSHTHIGTDVYRFFALSNLASLLALISYPFLIEPQISLYSQAFTWSGAYALFASLCAACGFYFFRRVKLPQTKAHVQDQKPEDAQNPGLRTYLLWLSLSGIGSWLLLAITNHVTQNVAAIPFLWLLPLVIYLLTFVLCFESDRWYVRSRFLIPTAALLAICAYGLQGGIGYNVKTAIPLYTIGLFFFCMFAHGELARMRPATRYLTRFYLLISIGGATGGIMIGLVAPRVLPAYYELGIGFIIIALLALFLFQERKLLTAATSFLALLCGYFLLVQISDDFTDVRKMERSFYGTLLTVDQIDENPANNIRELLHGSVKHGGQYLAPDRRLEPTTYYGPTAGIGLAIAHTRSEGKKVGVIGLGAGTLAVYGRAGDVYRFYEINPQVIELAHSEFTFVDDSKARIEIVQGDARLSLEKEEPQNFDVLAIDAFSGDSVPIHLITREAVAVYLRHMNSKGIIAFHVTNTFLSLAPVVQKIAADQGLYSVLIHDDATNSSLRKTDWVLIAKDKQILQTEPMRAATSPIKSIFGLSTWTDDFNNLFEVLK